MYIVYYRYYLLFTQYIAIHYSDVTESDNQTCVDNTYSASGRLWRICLHGYF